MNDVDVVGSAVVVGFLHSLLTASSSFVEIWLGSAVGYACVFAVVSTVAGVVYHELAARHSVRRTDRGADVATRDTGDA